MTNDLRKPASSVRMLACALAVLMVAAACGGSSTNPSGGSSSGSSSGGSPNPSPGTGTGGSGLRGSMSARIDTTQWTATTGVTATMMNGILAVAGTDPSYNLGFAITPNGPGNPESLPVCPERSVCQPNFGFDGPGTAALSICGLPLYGVYGANVVPISIINAPPNAPVLLRIGSYSPAFHVQYGATMVSGLPSATLSYTTDSTGKVLTSLWTGDLPADVHYQAVVEDANQPSGYTTSNAVRIDPLWTDMLAARNERYKLIRLNPCEEELYDLAVDPIELNDLLLQPLGAEALAAYEELAFELDTLR